MLKYGKTLREIGQMVSSESIKIELVTELVTLFRALSVYDIFIQELVHEFGRIVMIAFFIRRLFNYAIHTNDTWKQSLSCVVFIFIRVSTIRASLWWLFMSHKLSRCCQRTAISYFSHSIHFKFSKSFSFQIYTIGVWETLNGSHIEQKIIGKWFRFESKWDRKMNKLLVFFQRKRKQFNYERGGSICYFVCLCITTDI